MCNVLIYALSDRINIDKYVVRADGAAPLHAAIVH